jgi:hypothetical protein
MRKEDFQSLVDYRIEQAKEALTDPGQWDRQVHCRQIVNTNSDLRQPVPQSSRAGWLWLLILNT